MLYTDLLLFVVAMAGSIGAAYYLVNLPEVGGINALLSHENVSDKLSILPDFSNTEALITLLIIPLAVQWWSSGTLVQSLVVGDTSLSVCWPPKTKITPLELPSFNIMHYALRPWPWILVALASLVVFPDLTSIKEAFPISPTINWVTTWPTLPCLSNYRPD